MKRRRFVSIVLSHGKLKKTETKETEVVSLIKTIKDVTEKEKEREDSGGGFDKMIFHFF